MKECPFNKFKPCRDTCELYIEKTRQYTGQTEVNIVKGCTLRLGTEEDENMSNKLSMVQKETGESKNISLYAALAMLGDKQGLALLGRKVKRLVSAKNTP